MEMISTYKSNAFIRKIQICDNVFLLWLNFSAFQREVFRFAQGNFSVSAIKINRNLFCIALDFSYLCRRKGNRVPEEHPDVRESGASPELFLQL
jgi:hypothetical protein